MKQNVVNHLKECSILHFTCHIEVNSDPSESRILFADWEINPFSMMNMIVIKLENVELVYISTCNIMKHSDSILTGEGIHMTGGQGFIV